MLLIAALCVPWVTQAQELSDYEFRTGVDNSAWITLSNPTTLLGDGTYVDDSPASSITNIGFTFPFGDGSYSQFWVNANGMFSMAPSTTTTTTAGQFTSSYYTTALPKIIGIARDMSTGSNGYIRYELTGTAPERVLVCEFALSYTYGSSYAGDVKWQIQLHEDSSKVVIVYGPAPGTVPSSFQSGLGAASDDIVILDPSTHAATYHTGSFATTYSTWHGAYRYYEFVRPIITCPKPAWALATEVGIDEATVYWTPGGQETQWIVMLGDSVVDYAVSDTFYTFDNLNPNTVYNVGIRALCGAGDTSITREVSFRTLCTMLDSLPYSYGFEDLSTGSSTAHPNIPCWHHINNGTQYFGYPYVSSTTPHSGTRNLYWYGSTTATTYGDYQIVVLPGVDTNIYPINTLRLKFWARPSSTSYHPVFQVGVMTDPTDVSTFHQVSTVNVANVTTWQEFSVVFGNFTGSGQFIAVRLNRPTSAYYVYTDDFTLEEAPTCAPIISHHVTATAGSARITWSADPGFANAPEGYEVSYSFASNTSSPTTVSTTDPELTLTGLDPDSNYTVTIVADCGSSYSPAYTFNFSTQALACTEWDTTSGGGASSPEATYIVGTPGTSTTDVMPVNGEYNYSYCNHLILRSDIASVPSGTTYFSGIDFQYAGTTPMVSKTNCTIYMCHTTMTTCDNFANPADLVLVYEGPLNCATTGWNHFEFNRGTFAYNGTSNIIVAIVDNSGAHNSSETFYYENIGTSRSHRVYRDDAPYTFADLGTVTAGNSVWRSNMHLTTGGSGGGDCIAQATCAAPAVSVEQADNGDIELSWIPGYQETSWDVDYRVTGTATWTSVVSGTSNTDYTFLPTDLQPNTHYEFRVTALCSDTNIATTLAYTTPCGMIDSVPFTENFDTYGAGTTVFPSCWYKLGSTADRPYINSSTTYGHNNTYGLYFYAAASGYCYAIMPRVNTTTLNLNTLQVSFWARQYSTSYNCDFEVGVMTDPTNASTFTAISSVHPAGTTYESFEVPLSSYTGTGSYIAFRAIQHPGSSTAIYMMLDDVTLENAPSCPRVTNVQADNITQTDATISWTATAASEYEVLYGPSGFNLNAGTVVSNIADDSVNITGLTSNSAYDVYVRGICTDDTSNWSFVYTFRTACGMIDSVPFTENFDTYGAGTTVFPSCWYKLGSTADRPYINATTSYGHNNTYGLYFYAASGGYCYAVMPPVDTTALPLSTLQVSFWARQYSTSYNCDFIVGVMTDPTNASTFTAIDTVHPAGITYEEFSVPLASYTGTGNHVAFSAIVHPGYTSSTYTYLMLDDVTLELVPPCPRVEDLHAINATLDSITIVWTDTSSTNTSWVVEYDTVDFTPGDDNSNATSITVTDTIYNLSGLDSATTYYIYVYPPCGDYIGYRHITAATLAASPATVPYTCNFEEDGPNGWDFFNAGQANYWMVGNATGNTGRSMYITNDGTTNSYNISSISYSYAVRTFNFSEAGEYAYTYDWKGQGESHYYDFARIFVTPASEMFTAGDVLGGSTYAFSTAAAPATWIELTQSGATPNTLSQSSTWQSVVGTFNITNPGNYKFVVIWANDGSGGTQPPIAIDNVALQLNECSMVQNVTAAVNADNISISWTAGGDETEWYITLDSATVNLVSTSVTTTNYTFAGLAPNSNYAVTIRAICGVGDTSLAYSEVYHTPCTAVPIPYTENFDGLTTSTTAATGVSVPCWDKIMTGSSTYQTGSYLPQVYYSSTYAHSGSYSYRLYGVGYHMLPPMSVSLDSLQLTFWDYTTSASYGLEVGVMEGNTFIPVQVVNTPASTHAEVQVFFGSYTGNSRIIAFRNYYTSSTSTYYSYHYIDNINVDYIPSCPHITNLTSTGNTASSVTLDWVENGSATQWEVTMATSATGAPVADSIAYAHPFTFNGLTAGTNYYFWVRPICGIGDTGIWEGPFLCVPGSWNMRPNMTDTLHMCGGVIYDDGGPSGDYAMSQDSYIILYPDAPNNLVSISGTVAIEGNSFDNLYVYDGAGTSGTQLVALAGTSYSSGTTISATSTSGPLTIYFTTDGSVTYSGFALNVSCITTSCLVTNLALDTNVTSTSTSLALMWDAVTGTTGYEIEYGTPGFAHGTGTMLTSTTNHVVISGLTSLTNYEVFVRSLCSGGDTGSWTHNTFQTLMCDGVVIAQNFVDTIPGTTSTYSPMGTSFYNYGYNQIIIDSAYLAEIGGDISAIAFHPSTANKGDYYNHITVYLANIPDSLSLASSFIHPAEVGGFDTVITDRDMCYTTTDWQLHGFDQPFTWDGHSNILVSIQRNHGSYSSGASFNAHTQPAGKGRYIYQDGSAYDPSTVTGGTAITAVGDIRLYSCGGARCLSPNVLPTTDITYQSATINWNSNATDFEVAVRAATEAEYPAPTSVTGATSYTVSGLQPATIYRYQVRAICDATEELISDWVEGTFTTDSLPCFAPADLHTTDLGYTTATLAWTAGGNETMWNIHVWNTSKDTNFTATGNPYTVTGLAQTTTYNAAISALCGNGAAESEYSDTIQFTTATCAVPTAVTTGNITATTVTVSWNGSAQSYEIEYGDRNFNRGEGTKITVNGTTHQITGLESDHMYTLYVRSICEAGIMSDYSSQVDFDTPAGEGFDAVNGGMNVSIYPNPTTSATTIALSGVNGEVSITIVDMNGRIVMSDSMSCEGDCTKTMEVSGLAQGAYFVRLNGDNVNMVKKLVVK